MAIPITTIKTADAAASLRQLNQLRIRPKRVSSWRTLLTTFREKNGESVGSGTRPRTSHNSLSSSRSIVSSQLNYMQSGKLRSNGAIITVPALQGSLRVVEYELGAAFYARLLLRSAEYARE